MDSYLLKIKNEIANDFEFMISFCNERNIEPTLQNFLSFKKESSRIPECIYYFMSGKFCRIYFYNSKKWNTFFSSLDTDFQNDLGGSAEVHKIKLLVASDLDLSEYLSKILKKDFVWYNYGSKNFI